MAKKSAILLPVTDELLRQFGERLRLARLRRGLKASQMAERAGMAPMTLRGIERGGAGVTLGAYLTVMQVLGLEGDLGLLASDDRLGHDLQDARMSSRARAPARSSLSAARESNRVAEPPVAEYVTHAQAAPPASRARVSKTIDTARKARSASQRASADWARRDGFATSQALTDLLARDRAKPRKRR